jgi:hypothetical protein
MTTSQATATLTATHQPTGELVAYTHRPPRPLGDVLDVWRAYVAQRPAPRPPPAPVVVTLPWPLGN